jgi:hypothetical protein
MSAKLVMTLPAKMKSLFPQNDQLNSIPFKTKYKPGDTMSLAQDNITAHIMDETQQQIWPMDTH